MLSLNALPQGNLRAVERVALRALNADLLGALGLMAQADPIGSRWLAAHLADLLHHCRQLPHDLLVPSTQLPLRDTYLLEYAEELLADEGQQYLPLADYLSACFAEAAPRVRALLGLAVTRVRPRSETEAGRLLALCERFELEPEARSVLVAQAARRIAARRYGAAIRCLARAHDSLRLALLAKVTSRPLWCLCTRCLVFASASRLDEEELRERRSDCWSSWRSRTRSGRERRWSRWWTAWARPRPRRPSSSSWPATASCAASWHAASIRPPLASSSPS